MFVTILFAFSTMVILLIGVVLMATGSKMNKKYATKLMSLRVALQASAIFVLLMILYVFR